MMVESFGTHYVTKLHFGAVYGFMYTLSSSEYEELSQGSLSVEVQASYSGSFDAGIIAGVDKGKSMTSSKFREKASKKEFALGAKPPSDGEISTWTSSILKNPYPIKYELASIDELFGVDSTEIGDFLTAAEARKIQKLLKDEILPGYCEWLNKNDDETKPICQSSSNNEIDLFRTDVINSIAFGPYPSYPVWDYVTRFETPDEEACHQRCLNSRLCTQYSHFNLDGTGMCTMLVKDFDQGPIEDEIKPYNNLYEYSYLKPEWDHIDGVEGMVGIIVPKLERPAILKGVSFRDNDNPHRKKCHVSRSGFSTAALCMNVCSWDSDCVAYESTERGGL